MVSQVEMIRIAEAVLEHGKYSWVWVIPECPYCGKPHEHYGGALDGDPYNYLGQTMTAQCDKTDRRRLSPGDPAISLRYVLESAGSPSAERGSTVEDTWHKPQRAVAPLVAALEHAVVQLDQQADQLAHEIDTLMERPECDEICHRLTVVYGELSLTHDRLATLVRQLNGRLHLDTGSGIRSSSRS